MDAAPLPGSRPGFDWPKLLLLVATGGAVAVVAACLVALALGRGHALAHFMSMFLACFAIVKFAVAARAVREVRGVASGGIDPREFYGTPGRFWVWVGMKAFVAVLALGSAIFIFVHGPGSLA